MMSGICAVPGLLYRGQFPDIWHFIFSNRYDNTVNFKSQ